MTKRIDGVLARLKDSGYFPGIERFKYELNAADEMTIISAIGKMRTPDFVIDEFNRAAYENIVKWCIGDRTAIALHPETKKTIPADMNKGWWIAGNTGSGKSWCLDIIQAYCSALQFKVNFGGTEGRLVWRNRRADEFARQFQDDGTMPLRNAKIIGIHDVGTEQMESIYMGNRVAVIRNILEFRGDQSDMITFVTTNLPMNHPKIVELYGDRVQSRLSEMFNYIEIKGIDRRQIPKPNNGHFENVLNNQSHFIENQS